MAAAAAQVSWGSRGSGGAGQSSLTGTRQFLLLFVPAAQPCGGHSGVTLQQPLLATDYNLKSVFLPSIPSTFVIVAIVFLSEIQVIK